MQNSEVLINSELCLILEKEGRNQMNHRLRDIGLGKQQKFVRTIKQSDQDAGKQIQNFISIERINQVHQASKGSCICITGSNSNYKDFYLSTLKDYINKLIQLNEIKVEVYYEAQEINYQLQQYNLEIKRIQLKYEHGTNYQNPNIITSREQFYPMHKEIYNLIQQEPLLNMNIFLSVYEGFHIKKVYSLILKSNNMRGLIQQWQMNLINNKSQLIYRNTNELQKTIISFSDDYNSNQYQEQIKDKINQTQQLNTQLQLVCQPLIRPQRGHHQKQKAHKNNQEIYVLAIIIPLVFIVVLLWIEKK